MRLTLSKVHWFSLWLRDEEGHVWTSAIKSKDGLGPCVECGRLVRVGYSRRTGRDTHAYICAGCIELVLPPALIEGARS